MTICVGAKLPWGTIPSSAAANEVVFLLADTRYTYPSSGGRRGKRPPDNYGRKIFRLRRYAAAAFAGDIPAAEKAIVLMRECLSPVANPPTDEVLRVAEQCCVEAFSAIGRKRHGLWMLIGGREDTGQGYLIYTSSEQAFVPMLLPGKPFPIGEQSGKERLTQRIQEFEQEKARDGQGVRSAGDWLNLLYAALDRILRDRVDVGIGGRIQSGIISEDGFWEHEMVALDRIATPPEKDVWRRGSHKLDTLSGFTLKR